MSQRNGVIPLVLPALMTYFKEDLEILCIQAQVTSSRVEIEALDLPATPCIVYRGESLLEAKDYAVAVERKVLFDQLMFMKAITLLFGTYFVFNMEYPTEASASMEFMQRCFAKINTSNTKTKPKQGKKTYSVPPKVLRLINELAAFEWQSA